MKIATRILAGIAILLAIVLLTSTPKSQASDQVSSPTTQVFTSEAVTPALSRPVRDIEPQKLDQVLDREINPIRNPGFFMEDMGLPGSNTTKQDPLAPLSRIFTGRTPDPIFTFEGLGTDGFTPPDTIGEVGPNHYVQMVNVSFAIFDKSGNIVQGDTPFTALFAGSGLNQCATQNDGDPIVVWDSLADRWLLSQFAISSTPEHMCVAISQTADPTGAYYLYQFAMPDFPDYFKFGVWSDAYYMGTNTGFPNQYYAYAFDRASMLAGQPATYQYSSGHPNFMIPADLDGPLAPPADTPGFFYTMLAEGYPNHPAGVDRLVLYEFDVDWNTPANSTYGIAQEIPIADYNYTVCGFFVGNCIPQPGTAQGIDSLSYWPMWRFAYRNLNSYEAMVGNFTVDVDGTDLAAIRWFELQNDGDGWTLYQEGTHAPDSDHRFMGSIAMDGSGNIALGYSVSSSSTHPSIRYATRLRTDPLGTLQTEASLFAGTGSQTGIHRWGDYSSINVDPADECTFWYTNEYHDVDDAGFNWNTRVGVFRIPECTGTLGPDFTIEATPPNLDICVPDDAVYDVAVNYFSGFNSLVTLSATDLPPGATATFVPPTVITPTTASELTIGTTGATPGTYNVNIIGVSVPTPTHTTTVGLNLYDAVPGTVTLTAPADGATNIDLLPTFTWMAAAQGGSYYLEVATDMGFTNVLYSNTVTGLNDTSTVVLNPLTTYYWRVTPSNACGGGSASAVYSFITRDIPPILLVDDDDNGPDVRSHYTDILDNLGLFYDIWDTNNSDNEPTAAELAPYSMVIWFTGDEFGGAAGPGTAGEAALGSWLDGGKCLFLSSQDYHYDRGLTSFMQTYLGVTSMTDDNGDYTSVTGQGVVFSGLGPYSLTYPFTDFSDPVNPDATAEVAFVGDNSNNAAINKDSGVYRTTFWAFPFEALDVAAREEALQVAVDWCGTGAVTGTLDGNVSSAVTALGIQGATVTAVDGGYQRTVSTNAAGDYNMTVPVGTYNVTAAATNYVSATVTSVVILTNTVTTVDFVLDGSVLTYSPAFIEETMEIGDVVSNTVTVTNTGPLPIDWQATISNYGGPVRLIPLTVTPLAGEATGAPNPALSSAGQAAATASQPVAPFADVNMVLDDGTRENAIGLTAGGQFIWLNRFTPAAGDFPFTLTEVQILFGAAVGVNVGELVDIYVYEDTDGDGNPGTGANFLGSVLNAAVQATDDITWSIYPVTTPLVLNGPGDVLIAVVNRTAGTDPSEFPAAIDQTPPSAGRSWIGAYTAGNPGNPPTLPADNLWGTIDSFGLAGNWMVRGYGNFGAGSGAWASAVPDSGTIPANSVATFEVVFDASSLYQTGDYTAELSFSGTFVNEPPIMPLTMHLGCATCGFLEGEITDDRTGDPLSASIHITGPGGFDVTLSGDSYSNIAVQPGSYTIEVSADGYFSDSAVIAVTQGVTTVTDFALVPEYGELVYSPAFVEEFMSVGDVVSNTITVTNTGTIPFDFTVNIGNYGGPTVQLRPVEISIPRFEGTLPASATPPTTARAPQAPDKATNGEAYPMAPLGEMAYALDVFPGLNLVMFPDADAPGAWTTVAPVPQFHPAGDFLGSDFSKLYALDYDTNQFVSIDTTSGARTIIGTAVGNGSWSGMTGAVDGTLYVVSTVCGTSSTLYTINPTNAALTQIGQIGAGTCIIDIAINANGEMYGVDIVSDVLYQINPATGAGTLVGPLGVNANFAQGMDFEQVSGILYWAAYTTSGEMRVIDTTTGASALVGAFPGGAEVDALAFATGGGGAGGWAYPVPDSGTVPAGSSVTFELVFDATSLLQVGTYTAELSFSGDFENDPPVMPLTMHLDCPTCGFIDGSITDAFSGDPLVADIQVMGDGGVDITVTGDSYYLSLPADDYDITVSASGYFSETASITLSAGITITTDFALTPIFSELAYAPASYEVTIGLGTMLTETLAISNTGTIAFDFALSDVETGNPGMGRFYSPATTCPADAFGYTCTDSTEPDGLVSYDFEDISGTGTSVTLTDDSVSPALPMGFAFDYYGTEYSDIYISSNGFLTVLSGSPNGCCTGGELPSTTTPNGVIAGWWEDLNPSAGGTIQYQTLGDAPRRYMVVQFTDVPHFGGGNLVTLQYKLFEGSNNIEVHYQAAPSDGGTHSAGIENETGTIGLQYYRGTSALTTPLAVCYLYPGQYACGSGGVDAPWLVETPDTGTIEAGETVLVNLLFDATVITQTGTYTAELYFNGTFDNAVMPATVVMHVEAPVAAIGLSVTVGTEAGVCGTADTLEVASGTAVYYCYTVTNTGNVMLPSHTITDTVFGHIDTFLYDLMPGESESVIYPQTITADATSTARWTAAHTDLGLSAMAEDTVTVTVAVVVPPSYSVYLPFIIKP